MCTACLPSPATHTSFCLLTDILVFPIFRSGCISGETCFAVEPGRSVHTKAVQHTGFSVRPCFVLTLLEMQWIVLHIVLSFKQSGAVKCCFLISPFSARSVASPRHKPFSSGTLSYFSEGRLGRYSDTHLILGASTLREKNPWIELKALFYNQEGILQIKENNNNTEAGGGNSERWPVFGPN